MKEKKALSILFFARFGCVYCERIIQYMRSIDFDVEVVWSHRRGERLPQSVSKWRGQYVFSFRSLFILSEKIIRSAEYGAINFHPGPSDYRGIGCANFALYNGEPQYGVVAHFMDTEIDHGKIIEQKRFVIKPATSIEQLLAESHRHLFYLCVKMLNNISKESDFYKEIDFVDCSGEGWKGDLGSVKKMNHMQLIDHTISRPELERRIRAFHIDDHPLKIVLHGYEFVLSAEQG